MLPYIGLTLITCFFTYLDTRKRSDKRFSIYSIVVIICFSVFAGMRSIEVGTDTKSYYRIFQILCLRGYKHISIYEFEPLYEVLMIIAAYLTKRYWTLLLFNQVIICCLIYRAILEEELEGYSWVCVLLFNCLFFSFNLNLMRQCIAMAWELYGFKYVKQRKLLTYVIIVTISVFFHLSGILGIAIYPIYCIAMGENRKNRTSLGVLLGKYKKINSFFVVALSFIIVFFSPFIINSLAGVRKSFKYQTYNIKSYSFAIVPFFLMMAFIVPIIIRYFEGGKKDSILRFYMVVILVSVVLWQLTSISKEVYRVSLFFWQIIIFAVPSYLKNIQLIKNKIIMLLYYIVFSMLYFYIFVIHGGLNGVYPYFVE